MKRLPRQKYTLEFKLEAVRLVKEGMRPSEVAQQLGITENTLLNWRNAERDGKLAAGTAPKVTTEQMDLSRMRAELARLRMENEILKKAAGVLCQGVAVKYAWMDSERGSYPLEAMCTALGVSPSGYADWKGGGDRHSRLSDRALLALIRAIHAQTKGAYGAPRIWRELRDRDYPASKERVRRLMQEHGIRGRHKRRYKATTDSRHNFPVAPNLLDQQFRTCRPDLIYTADITYIPTAEGWLYLAVVLDLYTRMVVGWAMSQRMTRELVIDALRMAWFRRRPPPGLIHHSDRGSQYCSHDYQYLLRRYGMTASMSRKGNCWDNAVTESFFNSLKNERTHHARYATRAQARQDTFEYIELFYNRRRRHSALGYLSPAEFHSAWLNQQQQLAA
ncbi:MAG: IS3 family transposase [Nevskia sp.]|nr:IS3 family transposase [Nevskia sp.]